MILINLMNKGRKLLIQHNQTDFKTNPSIIKNQIPSEECTLEPIKIKKRLKTPRNQEN